MKKKIILIAVIVILLILFFPITMRLNDGGTIEYKALTYKISKIHKLNEDSENGYEDGWKIEVLGMEIYNKTNFSEKKYISEFYEIDNENGYNTFVGTVLEENSTYMIVEPVEGEEERKSSDKIMINYRAEHNNSFGVGKKVIIKYSGFIKETYPAQIDANEVVSYEEDFQKYSKVIDDIKLELDIPNDWKYEEVSQSEEDTCKYGLKLYKNSEEQYAMLYVYNNMFGVCGTGRTTKYMILNNGNEATIGYYDGNDNWSDISFWNINSNVGIMNCTLSNLEAKELLNFIKTINISENN